MGLPDLVLIGVNALYSTSYVAARVVLEQIPPATLALIRLALGALIVSGLVVTVSRARA